MKYPPPNNEISTQSKISVTSTRDGEREIIMIILPAGLETPDETWDTETLIALAIKKLDHLYVEISQGIRVLTPERDMQMLEEIKDALVHAVRQ